MVKSLLLLGLLVLQATPTWATNPNLTSVPQPVNLVDGSLAGCIPLTSVVCYANYNFGLHHKISAPNPFLNGARKWQRGSETNANLASVFGFMVNLDVPGSPVEINIKDWDVPPYSPHRKEEVLAATIHCLIQSSHASVDRPLEIQILTENKDDQIWAQPFAKKYIRLPGEDGKPVTPTPVGDTFIKTDGFGIQYVISPKLNPKHLTPKIKPAILPIEFNHDGKPTSFIPYWPASGTSNPLQLIEAPRGHFHDLFRSQRFSYEGNPLLAGRQYCSIKSKVTDELIEVSMSFDNQSLRNVTSAIASAALTARINYMQPLKVTIESYREDAELVSTLLKTPGWEKATIGQRHAASATFDYDPQTKSFKKGTLPDGVTIASFPSGMLYLKPNDK